MRKLKQNNLQNLFYKLKQIKSMIMHRRILSNHVIKLNIENTRRKVNGGVYLISTRGVKLMVESTLYLHAA